MNRRSFLAGLGMTGGLSLLGGWSRQAFASDTTPKRFVFVIEGNSYAPAGVMSPTVRDQIAEFAISSIDDDRSFSKKYGHDSPLVIANNDLGDARVMSSFAASNGRIDLTKKCSVTLGLSSTITGGGHSTYFGALSSTRSTPARAGGPTIDAVLAALPQIRQSTPFEAIRVGVHGSSASLNSATCAFGAGRAAPIVMDPTLAYKNLFGSVADADGQAAFARKTNLLTYAQKDVQAALSTFPASASERIKLERYLESVEALIERQSQLIGIQDTLSSVVPDGPEINENYTSEDDFDRLTAQFDIATASLIGGLSNIAVVAAGTGGQFMLNYQKLLRGTELEGGNRHDLHHAFETLPPESLPIPEHIEKMYDATEFLIEEIAQMARRLEAIPENGGTMLDNTVIVFLSGNGERHHSEGIEFPVLMVGGQNLGFKNDGRTTVFPGINSPQNRQLSNFYNTLCYAAGTEEDNFGSEGPSRIATGPLSELWDR